MFKISYIFYINYIYLVKLKIIFHKYSSVHFKYSLKVFYPSLIKVTQFVHILHNMQTKLFSLTLLWIPEDREETGFQNRNWMCND